MKSPVYLLAIGALVTVLSRPLPGQTAPPVGTEKAFPDSTGSLAQPRTALLLGIIPGGGQVYNRAWIKALIVVAAESYYVYQFQLNRDRFNHYDDTLPLPQGRYLEKRNKYAWWVALVYLWSMLDAYVDAHLAGFPPDTDEPLSPLPTAPHEDRP